MDKSAQRRKRGMYKESEVRRRYGRDALLAVQQFGARTL